MADTSQKRVPCPKCGGTMTEGRLSKKDGFIDVLQCMICRHWSRPGDDDISLDDLILKMKEEGAPYRDIISEVERIFPDEKRELRNYIYRVSKKAGLI